MEPFQITPEPDEAEQEAILEALADDADERPVASKWAEAVLPARGAEPDEP